MAKEYKVGEKYYLPVEVIGIKNGDYMFPVEFKFYDGDECYTESMCNKPDILLTAEEVYASRKMADEIDHIEDMLDYGRQKYDEIAELKAKVAKLEAENAEWKHNEQAYHEATEKLKAELDQRNDDFLAIKKDRDDLDDINDELRAEVASLTAERDDLKSQVGKYTADIQDLTAEIHFLKAQKEAKKPVHVFTNDGTEVEFRRYTDVTYRTDYNILVIKDGEEIVAGFIRGDRPGNLAYWWTE